MDSERTSSPEHWNMIYGKYRREELGWYAPILTTSLEWILHYAQGLDAGLIDVGGGSSSLIDELLQRNFESVTVVDISEKAINETQKRIGKTAEKAVFVCHDIRDPALQLPSVQLWHDRAAYHFLKNGSEIDAYLNQLDRSLKPNGILILGVFSENAPPKCSGLLVNRYTLAGLKEIFEPGFDLLETKTEVHVTPGNVNQEYIYTAWRKR